MEVFDCSADPSRDRNGPTFISRNTLDACALRVGPGLSALLTVDDIRRRVPWMPAIARAGSSAPCSATASPGCASSGKGWAGMGFAGAARPGDSPASSRRVDAAPIRAIAGTDALVEAGTVALVIGT